VSSGAATVPGGARVSSGADNDSSSRPRRQSRPSFEGADTAPRWSGMVPRHHSPAGAFSSDSLAMTGEKTMSEPTKEVLAVGVIFGLMWLGMFL
jgi:hypothetical protein